MDRAAFAKKLSKLMDEGHKLHAHINEAMTALDQAGDNARSAQWATLYNVLMTVGVANRIMHESVYPGPDAFAHDDEVVAMVCTVCRGPLLPVGEHGWVHADPADNFDCTAPRDSLKAMVAAGNESVPGPDDADPYSNARLHGEA